MSKRRARSYAAIYWVSSAFVGTLPALACAQGSAPVGAGTGAAAGNTAVGIGSGVATTINQTIYMGQWLSAHPAGATDTPYNFTFGTVWTRPQSQVVQTWKRQAILDAVRYADTIKAPKADRQGLFKLLSAMPATGRVNVPNLWDGRWLAANPTHDPMLSPGDQVLIPARPTKVTVIRPNGTQCQLPFKPGAEALAYVLACDPHAHPDLAWIAQPDGTILKYKVALWNEQRQLPPVPGARIWAPSRNTGWSEAFSDQLAEFLSSQVGSDQPVRQQPPPPLPLAVTSGLQVSPTPLETPLKVPSEFGPPATPVQTAAVTHVSMPADDLAITASDWGSPGLLQTPTARMNPAGYASISLSYVSPYARLNFMLQPLDWLGFGFRYTDVRNEPYGSTALSGTQTYKDKSIDVMARLWKESAYIPQVLLGIRDIGGTGLFSGEYFVASKRAGGFDFSLGMGWGYIGGRGDFGNPLDVLTSKAATRPSSRTSTAGGLSISSMFRGRVGIFGGVQYQLPNFPLVFKAELDGNNYRNDEPFGNSLPAKWPVNVGAVWRATKHIDLSAGYERGNTLMLGITLHDQLNNMFTSKVMDPAALPVVPARPAPQAPQPNWSSTAAAIEQQTGWRVKSIQKTGATLQVVFDNLTAFYLHDRIDRVATVLHRDAPANIDQFVLVEQDQGVVVASYRILRQNWVETKTQWVPPAVAERAVEPVAPISAKGIDALPQVYERPIKRFDFTFGPGYQQNLGGPNGFLLYDFSADASAVYRITQSTWWTGLASYRFIDNYNKFTYDAPSNLPRVRTYLRQYMEVSRLTMPIFQLTHVGKFGDNNYWSVYGGYLESMFGGVGAEYLYRPWNSRFAIGVDANAVRQRSFNQDFGFRNYQVLTGHVTAYWDTGYDGIQVNLSFGRYLAKDVGATIDISRKFQNGVTIGAYATKTNVSAEQFGEGSFDKGVYVNIPFDALLGRSVPGVASLRWSPLTRDGGAKLGRAYTLYDLTNSAGPSAYWFKPPAPPGAASSDR